MKKRALVRKSNRREIGADKSQKACSGHKSSIPSSSRRQAERAKKASSRGGSRAEWPCDIEEIAFYRANEKPYGAFSNLYRRPIMFEGTEFPTAEHAYQAGKARKKEVRDWLVEGADAVVCWQWPHMASTRGT